MTADPRTPHSLFENVEESPVTAERSGLAGWANFAAEICKSLANQLRVSAWYGLVRIGTSDPSHRYETGRPGTVWDGPSARQDLVVTLVGIGWY